MQEQKIEELLQQLASKGGKLDEAGQKEIIRSLQPSQKKMLEDALQNGELMKKLLSTPQAAAVMEALNKQRGGGGN